MLDNNNFIPFEVVVEEVGEYSNLENRGDKFDDKFVGAIVREDMQCPLEQVEPLVACNQGNVVPGDNFDLEQ